VAADVCTAPDNDRWHRTEYAREPVTNVSWNQAKTYAEEWAGGRLPTEAEWEKACRGGDGRIYPWGDDEPARKLLNYAASGLNGVVAVGSYPSGAYGLYDMAGNVAEWTSSKWKDYPYDAGDGREDPEGDEIRTVRGGSFGNAGYDCSVRCAYRDWGSKLSAFESSGFRVASGETPK
jgi:formylglycine-generating enzyme required for sulfatase activity